MEKFWEKKSNFYAGLAGLISTVLFIAVFTFPGAILKQMFMLLSPLPLALVALSYGVNAGVKAVVLGAVLLLVVSNINGAVFYLIMDGLPVLLTAYLFLRVHSGGENPKNLGVGTILSLLTVVSAVTMVGGIAFFPVEKFSDIFKLNVTTVEEFLKGMFMVSLNLEGVDPKQKEQMVKMVVAYVPSMLTIFWMMRVIIVMVAAQYVLKVYKKELRETPMYGDINLPTWTIIPLPIVLLLVIITEGDIRFAASNAFILLLTPFLFLGLSQVHVFARKFKSWAFLVLFVFYFLFLGLYTFAVLLVSLLGIVEFFINYQVLKKEKLKE